MASRALGSDFRTIIVEDHRPFLEHVCSTLRNEPHVKIVGQLQDGLAAVACASTLQPDLIIIDIGLPGLNGLEAAHRIRALAPEARIVFLTQESAPEIVHEAFDLGAWAYVIKAAAGRELTLALQAVMSGKKFVSETLAGNVVPPLA